MSIRLRLTLLYTAILALTLLVFGVTLYLTVTGTTRRVLEEGLAADWARLTESKDFQIDNVTYLPDSKGKTAPFVQTLNQYGLEFSRSTNDLYEGVNLPEPTREELRRIWGNEGVYTETTIGGERWLIYSKRPNKPDRNNREGIVRVARPIEERIAPLDTLRRNLIVGGVIATGLAFGIGFVLARTALRPIGRITATARAIETSQDFSRRVDYRGPQDEVGQLATTFNAMLAALQKSYQQTESALEAQRRFVADASHELRTPLTTIRGNLGLLGRTPPIGEEDRRAALADMVEETERMSRLVGDLLTLARADAGRPLRAVPVPLDPIIADVARQARLLAPRRSIAASGPPAAPHAAALGDPDALKQVLLILLDNAIRHTPPGAAIAVTATAGGGRVTIAVRDTGPGIAPEILPHLFERFYRADSARTGEGAGLGLAIARALVEGQGGTIAVESAPGQGSTFTVVLPQAPVGGEALAAAGGEGE